MVFRTVVHIHRIALWIRVLALGKESEFSLRSILWLEGREKS